MIMTPVILTGFSVVPGAAPAAIVVTAPQADPIAAAIDASAVSSASAAPVDALRGMAFLSRLSTLSHLDAITAISRNPQTVAKLASDPPAAHAVTQWWRSAPLHTQSALIGAAPALVGNLEGVPLPIRNVANRSALDDAADHIEDRLAEGAGRAERAALGARQHMLGQIEQALVSDDGLPRQLVTLDTEGEGRAVIAVGDVSSADHVSFLIPGMFFGVDAQIVAWTEAAATVVRQKTEWLERLGRGDETAAAIAWIGYRTPSLVNVASMELAREGRDALTASLVGLREARGDDQPYLSVLAHSYGSTAALLSLEEHDVWVDALAIVGSPGSTARSVDELHVVDGNVWVGAAEWDPIPASGVFGSQPLSPSYGAHRFSVAPGYDRITGTRLAGALSHNDYFADGGMSLRNLALIAVGEGSHVTAADRSAGDASQALARRLHRTI